MSTRRVVLHASAGTGKTHALSQRLLELLLEGADPESLLATTFTRKAAGEVHERVHERLLEAVSDAEARQQLLGEGSEVPSSAACRELLLELLRGPSPLRVQTLDGYFAGLAAPFALELGLPLEWRMASEVEGGLLVAEALERLMETLPLRELLALLRALRKRAKEGARATSSELAALVAEHYARWREAASDAFLPQPEPEPAELPEQLLAFEAHEVVAKADGTPNANWAKARTRLVDALREDDVELADLEALAKTSFVAMLRGDVPKFYGKEPPEGLREAAAPLIAEIGRRAVAVACARTAAHGRFMERLHLELGRLKEQLGVLRFEDLPHRLAALDADVLARRVGPAVQHLLLDEFQDTSLLQWRVLETQAREVLAGEEGSSFFCVGDLKQALYAWRGGEARLLAGMAERVGAEQDTLAKNWRSSPVVLRFVSRMLEQPSQLPVLDASPGLRGAASAWERDWTPPQAAFAQLPGSVAVHAVSVAEGTRAGERRELLAAELARRVRELLEVAPQTRVGVLVRSNVSIAPLLQALAAEGVRAGGAGGARLTDSDAVRRVLCALRLAEHPGDDEAWLSLRLSPLAEPLGLAEEAENVARGTPDERRGHRRLLGRVARRLRMRWERDGASRLASELLEELARREPLSAWDRQRAAQLVAALDTWEGDRDPLRLDELLQLAEGERVPLPGADGVEVLTVHQSKGLDYDAVFLPELDGARTFTERSVPLVVQPDPFERVERVLLGTRNALVDLDPFWGARRVEAMERETHADLCTFYVALTRARQRIEILLAEEETESKSRDDDAAGSGYAKLVRQALPADALESGTWLEEGSVPQPEPVAETAAPAPVERAALQPARLAELRADPVGSRAEELDVAQLLEQLAEPEDGAPRLRGLLWHAWCERIAWLAPGAATADTGWAAAARASLVREGARDDSVDLDAERAAFERALEAPDVRALFERPTDCAAEVELWRERALLGRDTHGRVRTLRMDRVHLHREAGALVAVEIFDFKTGRAPASDEEREQDHARQLQTYRELLAARLGLELEVVSTRRVYLGDGRVLRVG